jgi:hypothetical protein
VSSTADAWLESLWTDVRALSDGQLYDAARLAVKHRAAKMWSMQDAFILERFRREWPDTLSEWSRQHRLGLVGASLQAL